MIVTKTDSALNSVHAIKNLRTQMVLLWLLEFRYSNLSVLSSYCGINTISNQYRFFGMLSKKGLVREFKNVHQPQNRLFMSTAVGLQYLNELGFNTDHGHTRVQNLGRSATITHGLAVQEASLNTIHKNDISEVLWDNNIPDITTVRPDALLTDSHGNKLAIEVERYRKSRDRIYLSMCGHAENIIDGNWDYTNYYFDLKSDLPFYQKLCNAAEWPHYIRDKSTRTIKKHSGGMKQQPIPFTPQTELDYRSRFHFRMRPTIGKSQVKSIAAMTEVVQ